ncbi:MAG: Fic family protein [Xanthomonadales bacterium]|nr:Fic family protein [Xanthomonadales bacterium]
MIITVGNIKGGVGVVPGDEVVHMAPQANRIPALMTDLLSWLKNCEHPLLISSCIFHYEFEFIHPFSDGNGRMERLWQSLILSHWDSIFTYLPVESLIYQHQQNYYRAIRQSTAITDSAPFIEFILQMILDALPDIQNDDVNDGVNAKDRQLLSLLQQNESFTQNQLAKYLGLSKSTIERRIRKLKQLGMLNRTGIESVLL